jgi:predicted nucleic acid-binding protein
LERADAEKAAELFNLTGRRSKSFTDCCLAAIAIRDQAPMATSNRGDFAPMVPHGLVLV